MGAVLPIAIGAVLLWALTRQSGPTIKATPIAPGGVIGDAYSTSRSAAQLLGLPESMAHLLPSPIPADMTTGERAALRDLISAYLESALPVDVSGYVPGITNEFGGDLDAGLSRLIASALDRADSGDLAAWLDQAEALSDQVAGAGINAVAVGLAGEAEGTFAAIPWAQVVRVYG